MVAPQRRSRVRIDDQIDGATCLHQSVDDEREQLLADSQRRPPRSIEHLMEATKVDLHLVASVTQGCRDRTRSVSEQRTRQQNHHFLPCWGREKWSKRSENRYNGGGKGHEYPPE